MLKEVVIIKTIQEVVKLSNLTSRTLRYYEELGLLSPERTDTRQRLYSKKELTKLKLISRGKRYGFTLVEIKEMVLLFDRDRSGIKQLERTIEYSKPKLKEIDERIEELQTIRHEMKLLQHDFTKRMEKIRRNECE